MIQTLNTLREHIEKSISVKQLILKDPQLLTQIFEICNLCVNTFQSGGKVILAGNGGSAADAQHIAAEFVSRFRIDRQGLPSLSLSTDTSMLTAIGNDYGYDRLFARQLEANGRDGDLFIGISTSGTSKNVIEAMKICPSLSIKTVAFTGCYGGDLKALAEHCLCVPSLETALIQEAHIMIGHMLCGFVEDSLFGEVH